MTFNFSLDDSRGRFDKTRAEHGFCKDVSVKNSASESFTRKGVVDALYDWLGWAKNICCITTLNMFQLNEVRT